ncbi:MAG: fibronectin type III domain-containing protein, partial [Thermoguttaceae bacterium]|nr:fibronectin type III domain-containing protein [Thermoguttaceae bacterium]
IGSYGSTPDSVRFYNSLSESFNLPNVSAWTNINEPGVVNYEYDPNQPLFTDVANGDYTLTEGSQAVNRGDNAYVAVSTDLAGNERIQKGIVDLGAYESAYTLITQLTTPTIAATAGARAITVAWNDVENASGYRVLCDGKSYDVAGTKTSYKIEGLTPATSYSVSVQALGDAIRYSDSELATTTVTTVAQDVWLVTTTRDDYSEGTLRYALNHAADGDAIAFAASVQGGTIRLAGEELSINTSITIDGGARGVTIVVDSFSAIGDADSGLELLNVRVETNAVSVVGALSLVDSALRFIGDDAKLTATGALTMTRGALEGAAATIDVANNSRFSSVSLNNAATLAPGATMTVADSATINGTLTIDGKGVATSVLLDGSAALSGYGSLRFGGELTDVLAIGGGVETRRVLTIQNGLTVSGQGAISGANAETVVNGIFIPSGAFAIEGDFTLGADGALVFEVPGLNDYASVVCAGNVLLNGTIELVKENETFVPTTLDSFKVVKGASLAVGSDVGYLGLDFGGYAELSPEITADSLVFTVGWLSGPRVIALEATSPSASDATSLYVDVYFSQSIDPATFDANDVTITAPNGAAVPILAPQSLSAANNVFRIRLNTTSIASGDYSIKVGSDVRNALGSPMNQDGTPPNGTDKDAYFGAFSFQLANLKIAFDASTPTTGYLGSEFVAPITVSNVGAYAALGNWLEKIYLSKDATLSEDDALLATLRDGADSRYATGLEPGAHISRSVRASLPLDATTWTPGQYYLIAVVDAENASPEINETDNIAVSKKITLELPELADLTVTSVVAPLNATAGETAQIVWFTQNAGFRAANETWRESIYISTTGSLEGATLLKTLNISTPLASGESVQRRENVTIPQTGFVGEAYFIVAVDVADSVLEANETNNSLATAAPTALKQKLSLTVSSTQIEEGANAVRAVVSRTGDVSAPLTVTIAVSDATELDAPSSIVLQAGQSSASFYFSAKKDGEYDDDQWGDLTVSATGYEDQSATINVVNVDRPKLTLKLDRRELHEGESAQLTVTRDFVTDQPLTVKLRASAGSQLTMPSSVVILANESSVVVTVSAIDDDVPESDVDLTITTTSPNFISGTAQVGVLDDDEPTLALSFNRSEVEEGAGANAFVGTVTRAEAVESSLRVRLASSRTDKIIVPSEVVIPAGKTSVEFTGFVGDNGVVDGEVVVTVTATGVLENCDCSMTNDSTGVATGTITVLDNDGPALSIYFEQAIVGIGRDASLVVSRNTATDEAVAVVLTSSDPTALVAPTSVVIPVGSKSVSVSLPALEVDEERWVVVEATSSGFARATAQALVANIAAPDLTITEFVAAASATENLKVDASYNVVNQGLLSARDGWTEKVWLSSTRAVTNESILVASFNQNATLSSLEGDNVITRAFSLTLPDATNDYYLCIQIDTENSVEELVEANNSYISDKINANLIAPYAAYVQTDAEKVDPTLPLTFYGYAFDVETGARVPNADVKIFISAETGTRTITAKTDETGAFETTWTPFSNETGSYTIGATHPWYNSAPVQDAFNLMRMTTDFTNGVFNIVERESVFGEFQIKNKTNEPITGVRYEVEGLADNLQLEMNLSSTIIPGGGQIVASVTAKAFDVSTPVSEAKVIIYSNETEPIVATLQFNVYRAEAYLTCSKQELKGTMVPGTQKIVEFEIVNESGADSGSITIDLPDVEWMSSIDGTTLESLSPGEARAVQILLNPSVDMPLTVYYGSIIVNYENKGLEVNFNFRANTDNYGELKIKAVDEYYYYSEEMPTLHGATVKVVDSVTHSIVATATTDDEGSVTVYELPEGYYDVYVSIEGHNTYNETVFVEAGENSLLAFLPLQTVRYEWSVTPTQIEDKYDITIDVVYEVNVPAPVVVVDPPKVDLSDLQEIGQRKQVNFTVTNHGLIAAYDVTPFFDEAKDIRFTPLVDMVDVLPAQSSVVIPVIVERVDPFEQEEEPIITNGSLNDAEFVDDTLRIKLNSVSWDKANEAVKQGVVANNRETEAQLKEELTQYADVLNTTGFEWSGCSFGGGILWSNFCIGKFYASVPLIFTTGMCEVFDFITQPKNTDNKQEKKEAKVIQTPVEQTKPADCCTDWSKEVKVSLNFDGFIKNKVVELINYLPNISVDPKNLTVEVPVDLKYVQCCVDGTPARGYSGEFEGKVKVKGAFYGWKLPEKVNKWIDKFEINTSIMKDIAAFDITLDAAIGIFFDFDVSIKGKFEQDCETQKKKIELTFSLGTTLSLKAEAKAELFVYAPAVSDKVIGGGVSGTINFFTVGVHGTKKWSSESGWSDGQICVDEITSEISLDGKLSIPGHEVDINAKLLSSKIVWCEEECWPPKPDASNAVIQSNAIYIKSNEDNDIRQETYNIFDDEDSDESSLNQIWNNFVTADNLALGLGYASRERLEQQLGITLKDVLSFDESYDVVKAYQDLYGGINKGVCSNVKLQLSNQATFTRDAFDAQLILENSSPYELQDVSVDIIIYDELGRDATHLFGIYPPTTNNFYNADSDNLGNLATNSTGKANWTFIPSTEAAQDGEREFSVVGVLSYIDRGKNVTIEMAPERITVYPQPELDVQYFWQRDALADDPWTTEVEESIPFEVAVMAVNKGFGTAKDLSIVSAQPKIVDNQKGLLISFEMVDALVNGKKSDKIFALNLGDVDPGKTAIGEWFLTTTVQGHFTDYNATFKHVNGFNDLQFSLIKSVDVHELIRSVYDDSQKPDSLPDFLVNDVPDVEDLPDTLYLSTGEIEPVLLVNNISVVENLNTRTLRAKLEVTSVGAGWNYIDLPGLDPGGSEYELVGVVRSDGKELNVKNFWQTDRTFPDRRDVVYENSLHILDYFESPSSVTTYELIYKSKDETAPSIMNLEELPGTVSATPVESIDVEFSEPILDGSFGAGNITLMRDGGRNLINATVEVTQVSDKVWRISGLAGLTRADGEYALTVSVAGVEDQFGNVADSGTSTMTWINAVESPFVVEATRPAANTQETVDSIRIVFSQGIDASSFTLEDLELVRDGRGGNLLTAESEVTVTATSASEWLVSGLSALTSEDGAYDFTVKTTGLRGTNRNRGVGTETIAWIKDTVGPTSAEWSGVTRESTNYPYDALYLAFTEEIDFDSLSVADFKLTKNGVDVPLDHNFVAGVLPPALQTTTAVQEWKIVGLKNFASADGDYVLTLDMTGIADLAGNAGSGSFSASWRVDTTAPTLDIDLDAVAPVPTSGAILSTTAAPGVATLRWSSPTSTISGTLSEPNVVLTFYDATTQRELAATTVKTEAFSIELPLVAEGRHEVLIRATDAAGNWSESTQIIYVDTTAPFVTSATVDSNIVKIEFSESTNVQALIDSGAIVGATTIMNDSTGRAIAVGASAFSYDSATKTLSVNLNGVDLGATASAEGSSADVVPITISLDSSLFQDGAGNIMRGSATGERVVQRFTAPTAVVTVESWAAPSLADWNGDGLLDLVVGEKTSSGAGQVAIYLNSGTNAEPSYGAKSHAQVYNASTKKFETLTVAASGCLGASPRAVDFNGDGALDLFVGRSDGTILYYAGSGSGANWRLNAPIDVTYGVEGAQTAVDVGNRAMLEVCDWNGDGKKDLLVGSMEGAIYLLVNSATSGAFDFERCDALTDSTGAQISVTSGRSAPTLADVDGDGLFDLISGSTDGPIVVYLNEGSATSPRFGSAIALQDVNGAISLDGATRSRPFAYDIDGDGFAELYVGDSTGLVTVRRGIKASVSVGDPGESGAPFVCTFDLDAASVAALPAAPSNLVFTNFDSENRSVLMSWTDNSANETGFKVEYSPDGGATWRKSADLGANVTSRTATGLVLGRTYNFRVAAYNAAGQSAWTYGEFEASLTPTAPSDLVFTNYSSENKTVQMSWTDNSNNEAGFLTQYSLDGKTWKQGATLGANETSRTATGVKAGQKYYFRVAAYNEAGQSDWTTGEFEAPLTPSAPSNLVFTNYSSENKTVQMSWTDNSNNEAGFLTQYSLDGKTWKPSATLGANETSRTATGVKAGQKYYFRVAAYNEAGQSDWTTGEFEAPIAPNAPSDLVFGVYDASTKSLPMSWIDNSDNESGFITQFSSDGETWELDGTTVADVTTRTATNVEAGQKYYFRVAAFNEAGRSDWTYGEFAAPIAPNAPSDLVFANYSGESKSVQMSWTDKSNNETGFITQYSLDGTTWKRGATLGANVTSRTATGIEEGQKYYFRVAAYNEVGQSDWTYGEFEAPIAPTAPSDLLFTSYSSEDKTVQMSWTDNSNNETGFLTQYSLDGKTWKQGATLGANVTSRTATGIEEGQKYYFRVAAYNEAGQSDWTYGEFEALLAPSAPS